MDKIKETEYVIQPYERVFELDGQLLGLQRKDSPNAPISMGYELVRLQNGIVVASASLDCMKRMDYGFIDENLQNTADLKAGSLNVCVDTMDEQGELIPDSRFLRRGIGQLLATLALDEAEKQSYDRVFTWPDDGEVAAIELAKKLGFESSEDDFTIMYKDL